jgi:hypothetical protein
MSKEKATVAPKPETRSFEFSMQEANNILAAIEFGVKAPNSPTADLSLVMLTLKQKFDNGFKG